MNVIRTDYALSFFAILYRSYFVVVAQLQLEVCSTRGAIMHTKNTIQLTGSCDSNL